MKKKKINHKKQRLPKQPASLFRSIMLAFSLVTLLSCVLIGLLTYYSRSDGIRAEQYRLLETLRDEKIKTITTWYHDMTTDIHLISEREDIRRLVNHGALGRSHTGAEVHTSLKQIRKANSYQEVFVTDNTGAVLATTEPDNTHLGTYQHRKILLTKVLAQRRALVSDIIISRTHHLPVLFFLSPITEERTGKMLGVLGIVLDPAVSIYPQFTQSSYLGATGEILLVTGTGVVQSPLKYRHKAIGRMTIQAEPAKRGAAGHLGRIEVEDYRQCRVMAAYGHIPSLGWGIVVKQDMSEINAPVRAMAKSVIMISLGVLFLALLSALIIARRIARPAAHIASAIARVDRGDFETAIPREGPAEIQQIAENMESMVARIGIQVKISSAINNIQSIIGRHTEINALLDAVIPALMEQTGSHFGVVYLTSDEGTTLDRVVTYGGEVNTLPSVITASPPDNALLSLSVLNNKTTIIPHLHRKSGLTVATAAGLATPKALLSLPLFKRNVLMGVVGMATIDTYSPMVVDICEGLKANLTQAIELCLSFNAAVRMQEKLQKQNKQLTATNAELITVAEELKTTTEDQKLLLETLNEQKMQVAEADRLKSEFLSNMSHELRTPLNSVLSLTQLMLSDGFGDPAEDRERLAIVERNGRHLLSLINDILDLSKIEAGHMELMLTRFDVAHTITNVVATVETLARAKGLQVEVACAPSLPIVSDEAKLQQILLNLLSNAQKFTDTGKIGISATATDTSLTLEVWDTGCGIPAEALPFIFDEFRQVDGSTSRKYGGTGLGLAICNRLTTMLQGTIVVESRVDHGTRFRLTFARDITHNAHTPMKVEPQREKPQTPVPAVAPGVLPHLLVVEDNPIAARQIMSALTSSGLKGTVAADGADALERIATQRFHGIILDIMLPNVDGFEVLRQVRRNPLSREIPVLVVTAKNLTVAELSELHGNHIFQLIQKGEVNRESLITLIREMLGLAKSSPEPPPKPLTENQAKRGYIPRGARVLIVDDNADNLRVTQDILSPMGFSMDTSRSGEAALALLREKAYSVMITDIQLPGMSGTDLVKKIRNQTEHNGMLILALTSKAMRGDKEEILSAGCDEYLSKPIEPVILRATLRKWLEQESHDN